MKMPKSYAELVAQAEQAVAAVKDAELRRVAFERILNDLLGGGGEAQSGKSQGAAPATKRAPSKPTTKKRSGPQAYVEEMVEDGFFKKPKTISEVKAELENRGHHIPLTSLSGPMQKLCQKKVLRRQKPDGKTFSYSNW
jgi:membrane protein involved in colicin uptake